MLTCEVFVLKLFLVSRSNYQKCINETVLGIILNSFWSVNTNDVAIAALFENTLVEIDSFCKK